MKTYYQINLGIFSENQEIQKNLALGRAKKACFLILKIMILYFISWMNLKFGEHLNI